jgi:hypothetical protein
MTIHEEIDDLRIELREFKEEIIERIELIEKSHLAETKVDNLNERTVH